MIILCIPILHKNNTNINDFAYLKALCINHSYKNFISALLVSNANIYYHNSEKYRYTIFEK